MTTTFTYINSAMLGVLAAGACFFSAGCSRQDQSIESHRNAHSPSDLIKSSDTAQAVNRTEQVPEGGATSGGGYVYGYEANPWFLANTKEVTYCVDVDEANFGLSKSRSTEIIRLAIAQWQSALQQATYSTIKSWDFDLGLTPSVPLEPSEKIELGTQNFTEVSCAGEAIDLRFQLGTLSAKQLTNIGNPRKYVASAVQTGYDEVNMRGQGFIYVAPEIGPLRPDDKNAAGKFWSEIEGIPFQGVVLHELGHVFGFSHHADHHMLMSQEFPQELVSAKVIAELKEISPRELLEIRENLERGVNLTTHMPKDLKGFVDGKSDLGQALGLAKDKTFAFVKTPLSDDDRHMAIPDSLKFDVFEMKCREPIEQCVSLEKVGTVSPGSYYCAIDKLVPVRFPQSQEVFSINGSFDVVGNNRVEVISYSTCEWHGRYESLDGKFERTVTISQGQKAKQISRARLTISTGLADGRIVSTED